MKKIFLSLIMIITLFLTGCGNVDTKKLRDNFINDVENIKSYYMTGTLMISNNDDTYNYDVSISYSKEDNFKVVLKNKSNNYEQVILRNSSGVYVVNTSLNKSFKFQSEWPYNNSQSYLLHSLMNDLKNDDNYDVIQKDNNFVYKVNVNYPNNTDLVKQNIYIDKNAELKMVEVLDNNDISKITFKVSTIDKNSSFKDDYFEIDSLIDENKESNDDNKNINETAKIDDALFPLYLPTNTSLSNKEVIKTTDGERVIMTFSGDNSFILVQENVNKAEEFTIVPSYGEPYLLIDTVGALTDTSYTWISNGVEYYIVSDVLSTNEILEVAKSINVVATIKEK